MMLRAPTITLVRRYVLFVAVVSSLSRIAATETKTAVLFGATGTVGSEILSSLLTANDKGDHFFQKVVLVGRRKVAENKIYDKHHHHHNNNQQQQQQQWLPEVVQIQAPDLSTINQQEHLLPLLPTIADACFIAVGSAFPHLSDLSNWYNVDVTMAASITKLCGKLKVGSVSVFTAIEAEVDPEPYSESELSTTTTTPPTPQGWWPVILGTVRMMGWKEQTIVSHATEAKIPRVRIFQPSNIVTETTRYGWLDWTVFKFHGVFDPWLPTDYHSVTPKFLANAMVQDSWNVLSERTESDGDAKATTTSTSTTRFTYGDFVRIVGDVDGGDAKTEL